MAKASFTSEEKYNFYAMIIDATFPYKTNKEFYICSMKIVDPTLHAKGAKASDKDFATLVLYAKRFEDLPIIHRIGDIIRVHRAQLRHYNGQRQFNASIYFNSSWALFSGDKKSVLEELGQKIDDEERGEYAPFAHSGKHCTIEKTEKQTIANLKAWAKNYVSNNDVVTKDMYESLAVAAKKKNDFDLLCKILHVLEKDEYTNELKLKDASGNIAFCQTLKMKFPHLKSGDVVRIRSANYDETATSRKVINLYHYSNVMTFVSASKLAKHVRDSVKDDKASDKGALKQNVMMNPVVLTEVDKKYNNMHFTSLHDLFHNETDAEIAGKNTFRTSFYVSKIEATEVKEWTKSFDKKTKKATSFKGAKSAANAVY